MGGRLLDYIGQGVAADRPVAADMPTLIAPGAAAIYFANDTSIFSFFNDTTIAWVELDLASLSGFSTESIQDLVGAMMVVSGSYITVTYDDVAGTIEFSTSLTQYTDEMTMDAVNALLAAGTHVGLIIAYDDLTNSLSFQIDSTWLTTEIVNEIYTTSIGDLVDVDIATTPPVDGQALVWDAVGGNWIPGSVAAGGSFQGTRVHRSANLALAAGAFTTVTWDSEQFDTNAFWDAGSPTRLTVADAGYVSVYAGLRRTASVTDQLVLQIEQFSSGGISKGIVASDESDTGGGDAVAAASGPVAVAAGDYFTCIALASVASSIDGGAVGTFFGLTILGAPGVTGPTAGSGTAFPSTPTIGDRFYRTDRNIEYFWNGTYWLSTQLHSQDFAWANPAADASIYGLVPYKDVYDLWLERLDASYYRNVVAEWDTVLAYGDSAAAYTVIATADGSGDTAVGFSSQGVNIGILLNPAAQAFRITFDEISGSATVIAMVRLWFRLVG